MLLSKVLCILWVVSLGLITQSKIKQLQNVGDFSTCIFICSDSFFLSGYFQGLAFGAFLGGGTSCRSCSILWRRVWMLLEIWAMWC